VSPSEGTVDSPLGAPEDAVLERLAAGDLEVRGRLLDASNASLFCTVTWQGQTSPCIYKPRAGERPLWDFPTGTLSQRELAAYLMSEWLRWSIVPPTVWRDGPYGPGTVQHWVDVDESVDLVELVRSDRADLRQIAVFDVVVNNADRKGGHLLPTASGHIFGIDHGVTFSVHDKVRTLLWQWAGDPIPDQHLTSLEGLLECLRQPQQREVLSDLLSGAEVRATVKRIERLLRTRRHPQPSEDWPALPWPPF
jgi:hypothetical protein